ncbi:tyrosine-type recombinase/integrase [Providencia hangzhouensis]
MTDKLKTCVDSYLDSFAQSFADNNYKPETIKTYLHLVQKLGKIMDTEGISPQALTPDIADKLARTAPPETKSTIRFYNLARRFAEHLINIGIVPPVPLTDAQVTRAELLADYEVYLVKHRGLSPRTIYHALRFANRFLDYCFSDAMIVTQNLNASYVIGFIQSLLTAGTRPYRDKTVTTHLRAFLQYLFGKGATTNNLALSIPSTHQRWGARLPRHISSDGVEKILASVRRNPRHGARDYAMLLLMARLGLRAAEVIAIRLDDINWRAGELLVRGKGQLHDRVPITPEIGSALIQYLREERKNTHDRTLFVTHRAPHRAFVDGQILNMLLSEALAETGQKPVTPYVGSHLLRHSLAVKLINSGSSLDEVRDILRHRSRLSTMIYARLDTDGLRSVAQPWPVAEDEQ